MIGKRLSHYEITALLGKGGMGEVYRARDSIMAAKSFVVVENWFEEFREWPAT